MTNPNHFVSFHFGFVLIEILDEVKEKEFIFSHLEIIAAQVFISGS